MEGLNDTQMAQVRQIVEQGVENNNVIIGQFTRMAADKIEEMQKLEQHIVDEVKTQTERINERVVELNELKEIALKQTANLNDRSVEIEAKLIEIEQKLVEADTKHGDLITNLGEFGEKQTSDISASRAASINDVMALRANIELWATAFQGKIESHLGGLSGVGNMQTGAGGAGGQEKEKRGPQVDRKEVAVWKLADNVDKDGFRHWIDAVDNQLEAVHFLAFPELVLERVRRSQVEVGKAEFEQILEDVMRDNDTVEVDLKASWQFVEKSRFLHTYFLPKLNTELHGKCISVANKNGFEVYRRICEAVDAVPENAAFIMQAELMALVKNFSDKVKNIRDLYGFRLHLDKKIIAFKRAIGDEPDAANLKLIIWNVMDPAQRLVAS